MGSLVGDSSLIGCSSHSESVSMCYHCNRLATCLGCTTTYSHWQLYSAPVSLWPWIWWDGSKDRKDVLYSRKTLDGRGLTQIVSTYKITKQEHWTHTSNIKKTISLPKLKIVKELKKKPKKNHSHCTNEAVIFKSELNMPKIQLKWANHQLSRNGRQTSNPITMKEKMGRKCSGQYLKWINGRDVDQTSCWLKTAGLQSETEGLLIAAQDQCTKTNCYWKDEAELN